ncbi:MAG: VOC family protein [Planctomycetes bacterium]|nr:VOC family protein [Planctomycetota bacterium]
MFIEHVNLTVSNLPRSLKFYRRLFGWDVRWQGTTTGGTPAAHLGDERCYVALFEAPKPGRWAIDYEAVGFNHFGVVVDDLDAMTRRLDELGAEHGLEQDYEPGRRVYFIDPDGIEVELVQYQDAVV